ncbi:TPA: hypothetical protein R9Y23_005414 [Bacillus cereus]|nr:hypothetical protein [Bacillus cereus]HEF1869103.1 hypothetical protein [Bacillus cereus]HEF1879627.1 hypothetical protein [Bacillus cereus]HEF1885688.1 hypothetical protein [Bacillus cereus]
MMNSSQPNCPYFMQNGECSQENCFCNGAHEEENAPSYYTTEWGEQQTKHPSSMEQEAKQQLSFQSIFELPKGYRFPVLEATNFVYNLTSLYILQEKCKKLVRVENYGQTEVDLHVLKIKGGISFITNIHIEPECQFPSKIGSLHPAPIQISIVDMIAVDHVLKYSFRPLLHHNVDTNHIQITDIQIIPVSESEGNLYKLCGTFRFFYE